MVEVGLKPWAAVLALANIISSFPAMPPPDPALLEVCVQNDGTSSSKERATMTPIGPLTNTELSDIYAIERLLSEPDASGEQESLFVGGTYVDEFAKGPDGWRFQKRTEQLGWTYGAFPDELK
jgi:hypothetical protein